MGALIYEYDSIEVWSTPKKESENKWMAIFNRKIEESTIQLSPELLQLNGDESVYSIWDKQKLIINKEYTIGANGVLFLKVEV